MQSKTNWNTKPLKSTAFQSVSKPREQISTSLLNALLAGADISDELECARTYSRASLLVPKTISKSRPYYEIKQSADSKEVLSLRNKVISGNMEGQIILQSLGSNPNFLPSIEGRVRLGGLGPNVPRYGSTLLANKKPLDTTIVKSKKLSLTASQLQQSSVANKYLLYPKLTNHREKRHFEAIAELLNPISSKTKTAVPKLTTQDIRETSDNVESINTVTVPITKTYHPIITIQRLLRGRTKEIQFTRILSLRQSLLTELRVLRDQNKDIVKSNTEKRLVIPPEKLINIISVTWELTESESRNYYLLLRRLSMEEEKRRIDSIVKSAHRERFAREALEIGTRHKERQQRAVSDQYFNQVLHGAKSASIAFTSSSILDVIKRRCNNAAALYFLSDDWDVKQKGPIPPPDLPLEEQVEFLFNESMIPKFQSLQDADQRSMSNIRKSYALDKALKDLSHNLRLRLLE